METPNEPIEPARRVEPDKPIEPARRVEPDKPIEPARRVEPGKPIEPARRVEPGKPIEPARRVEPDEARIHPTEGDEPGVERAESLHMPARRWALLWGLPIAGAIVVFVVLVHLAG